MTGLKGKSEFPETLEVPQGETEGNIEVEENKTQRFPRDTSKDKFAAVLRNTTWSRASQKSKLFPEGV